MDPMSQDSKRREAKTEPAMTIDITIHVKGARSLQRLVIKAETLDEAKEYISTVYPEFEVCVWKRMPINLIQSDLFTPKH